jgi:anthranilate phosphoribosyltransferase
MTGLLEKLRAGAELDAADVRTACDWLFREDAAIVDRAEFLKALHTRGETPREIAHFVQALLEKARDPGVDAEAIDVCGTGGDKAGLFNVSTAVMFVAAACGARVVKHGNRGITSKCGGADVLEALGVRLDLPPAAALDAAGCCFLFAPSYHPAFRAIAPVRQALAAEGSASIFNLLGPLLNPARPHYQLSGVFHSGLLAAYAEVFALLGRHRAWAVHGSGGLDEISTFGPTDVCAVEGGRTDRHRIDPSALGLPVPPPDSLRGGDATANAARIEGLLTGRETGPAQDLVAVNTAGALVVFGTATDLPDGLARAREAMTSGRAFETLAALRRLSAG